MKLLFKGGKVVSGKGTKKMDILVKGEKILAVGENLAFKDADIIDVRGKLLFPGFIDAHTHMALEVSNTVTADKFDTPPASSITPPSTGEKICGRRSTTGTRKRTESLPVITPSIWR